MVVAVYGPSAVARSAVRRARALAGTGEVVALPGSGAGVDAVTELRGVRTVARPGTAGLVEALTSLPAGPALLVHDDVFLSGGAFAAMVRTFVAGGMLVVPWSNDIGMDHFCGPLPPSSRARSAVEARARGLSAGGPVRVVRPSCLLGSRDDLLALAPSHLVDPRLRLEVVDLPVAVAPRAVAAHDSSCARRLADPPSDRPLLVAAMIVRNEEAMLPGCLASLEGVVDEVIVCDTGSTDATVDVALRFGATVIHRPWRDDFGWARTEAIEAASHGAWVLTVDADDRLVCDDPVTLRGWLASYIDEYEAFTVKVENRTDIDGPRGTTFDSPRIFRGGRFAYRGVVHEVLVHKDGASPVAPQIEGIRIVHLGYRTELLAGKRKVERNLMLAREQLRANPSAKSAVDYVRSVKMSGGGPEETIELLEGFLDEIADGPPAARAYVHTLLADDLLAVGDPVGALEQARRAVDLVPADDMAARAFARAALALGRPEEVLAMEERREATRSVRPVFQSDAARASCLSLVARAHAAMGRWIEAVRIAEEGLSRSPEGFEAWDVLVEGLGDVERLVGLALRDPGGGVFDAAARRLRPAETAHLCRRYLERGGRCSEAVRTGLVAAMVSGSSEDFRAIAAHTDLLEPPVVERIAERARARGQRALARLLVDDQG